MPRNPTISAFGDITFRFPAAVKLAVHLKPDERQKFEVLGQLLSGLARPKDSYTLKEGSLTMNIVVRRDLGELGEIEILAGLDLASIIASQNLELVAMDIHAELVSQLDYVEESRSFWLKEEGDALMAHVFDMTAEVSEERLDKLAAADKLLMKDRLHSASHRNPAMRPALRVTQHHSCPNGECLECIKLILPGPRIFHSVELEMAARYAKSRTPEVLEEWVESIRVERRDSLRKPPGLHFAVMKAMKDKARDASGRERCAPTEENK